MLKTRILLLSAVLLFIFSVSFFGQNPPTANVNLTADQWREDLRFMANELPKRHKNLFHSMTREEYEAAVKNLYERIPSLEDHKVIVGLMRIIAMIGDGHTRLRLEQAPTPTGVYPLRFYWYKDGLFVQAAAPEYKDLVGGKVVGIGKGTTEQALNSISEIVWRDNEMGIKNVAPTLISIPEMLHALKISESLNELKLAVEKGGKKQTVTVKPTGQIFHLFQAPPDWTDAREKNLPLWMKDPRNNFWFEYLKDQKILYVQYNAVQNKPDETVAAFFNRVYEFIEKNPVEKLVIDMRNNSGGNNTLNRPIVIGLIKSKVNQRGKVFGIIGRQTFSAAQNAVNELEKYTNIIFVGEPTGASPNHYGDATDITLPNSKLKVRVSTLLWQDMDPRDTREWTAPEIAAELSSEDYRQGRDPAMEAIINYKPGKSFADLIEELRKNQSLPAFIEKYRAFKADPQHKFINTENAMNRLGYQLLGAKMIDPAIEIFKLNTQAYPESSNVYDSLAEAYMVKGEKEKAIEFYQKSLELNPKNTNAVEKIKELKTKR